jgi:hypothetical protein
MKKINTIKHGSLIHELGDFVKQEKQGECLERQKKYDQSEWESNKKQRFAVG